MAQLADDRRRRGCSADRLARRASARPQRTRAQRSNFKKAGRPFLVATDVAARGIDVDELELLVVNDHLP
jgi:superfamily II DNA/RNA helicase